MSMQEDARARRISTEIMKHRLYENVITATRPRCLSVGPPDYNYYPFLPYSFSTHSMPVTPFRGSHETSPASTPSGSTNTHGFFRFYSRGTTPKCTTPVEENCTLEESSSIGLASLFGRYPRQGSVSRCHISEGPEMEEEETKADVSSDDNVPPWTEPVVKKSQCYYHVKNLQPVKLIWNCEFFNCSLSNVVVWNNCNGFYSLSVARLDWGKDISMILSINCSLWSVRVRKELSFAPSMCSNGFSNLQQLCFLLSSNSHWSCRIFKFYKSEFNCCEYKVKALFSFSTVACTVVWSGLYLGCY